MLKIDLSGKVALVTGGSRGIGAGISKALSLAGAKVILTHTQGEKSKSTAMALVEEIKKQGGSAKEVAAEVQDFKQVQDAVEGIIKEFKTIDILVANAGTTSRRTVEELDLDEWERIVKINLTGAFNSVKAVTPYMLKQKKGSVILIGSAAIVAGGGGGVHYASAKSALEGLNRGLTKELACKGIRSNIVHPSLIETDLLNQRYPDPESKGKLIKEVPIGRLGKPEDIANLVAFLASDLSSYITGQSIYVDGGRTFCR